MAAAAVITADQLATEWIFKDDNALTVEDIRIFLASREAVSAGRRAYDWLCGWVSANSTRFYSNNNAPVDKPYGVIEDGRAFINKIIFSDSVQDAGFSVSATLSYLKSNNLIDLRSRAKGYTKGKRINGIPTECVVLRMPPDQENLAEYDSLPL
jgi:hypothetical protein